LRLDDALGFAINNTGRAVTRLLMTAFAPYDVTPEQWSILKRLEEGDEISIKELSKRVGKDQANVTRISDLLERKGLVLRKPNPEDKRSSLVCLTEEGKQIIRQLDPIDEHVQQVLVKGIAEHEMELVKQLLTKMRENCNAELQG